MSNIGSTRNITLLNQPNYSKTFHDLFLPVMYIFYLSLHLSHLQFAKYIGSILSLENVIK
jgi:hypothetical protein